MNTQSKSYINALSGNQNEQTNITQSNSDLNKKLSDIQLEVISNEFPDEKKDSVHNLNPSLPISPIQLEINYIIEREMPVKIENITNFLSQFISLLNPSSRISKSKSMDLESYRINSNRLEERGVFSSKESLSSGGSHGGSETQLSEMSPKSGTLNNGQFQSTTSLSSQMQNELTRVKFRITKIAAGRIEIGGFMIHQAKINLKFSSKANPTMFVLSKPYVFHNLQKSHHLAIEALNRMEKFSQQRKRDLDSKIPKKILLERMHRSLSELSRLLIQIKEHLETDSEMLSSPLKMQQVTPYASVQRLQDSFNPKLPRDCLLEFSIQNTVCIITLYKLIITTPEKLKEITHKLHKPTSHISIMMPDGKHVAYIQSIYRYSENVDCKFLQDASISLRNAYQTCSRLKDKLDQLKEFDV